MNLEVGIINLDNLIRIRKSFRLRWRLIVALMFLPGFVLNLSALLRFAIHYIPVVDIATAGKILTIVLWVSMAVILILTIIACFRTDDFARLLFAFASSVAGINTIIFLFYPQVGFYWRMETLDKSSIEFGAASFFFSLTLILIWKYLFRYSYVLWLSIIPLGSGRACRQQVVQCLNASLIREQKKKGSRKSTDSNRTVMRRKQARLLMFGGVTTMIGIICWIVAFMAVVTDGLANAINQGEYSTAFAMVMNFGLDSLNDGSATLGMALWGFVFLAVGYYNVIVFPFLWNRLQRSKEIPRVVRGGHIPPGRVLLLRHTKDDVLPVYKRKFKLSRIPFMAFAWSYTFEELMADRLNFVGSLYALCGKKDGTPVLIAKLYWLKKKLTNHRMRTASRWVKQTIKKHRTRLPLHLSPKGAERVRLSNLDWRRYVMESMEHARSIIIVIGSVRKGALESQYLQEEMDNIKGKGLFNKSIFLMPPVLAYWKLNQRWSQFAGTMLNLASNEKGLPKAKRVLGVCFYLNQPVIITGSERSELFYESALDVAGVFVGGEAEIRGEMIMKRKMLGLATTVVDKRMR